MLRAVEQGYGGHVRLERRTMTGSMYFSVTAPQGAGELTAALAGRQDGAYFVQSIGPLARDRRGQLTLAWQFDPRSIGARPLEAYAWVVVAKAAPCAVALAGNLEGSKALDLAALARAVCAGLSQPDAPAADLPAPEEIMPGTDAVLPTAPAQAQPCAGDPTGTPPCEGSPTETPPMEPAQEGGVRIYTRSRLRARSARRGQATQPSNAEAPRPAGDGAAQAVPPSTDVSEAAAANAARQAPPEAPCEAPAQLKTAAKLLGLDITQPWPEAIEGLRRLFATQAPADAPLQDGYVYIAVPQPGGGQSLVGLQAENGVPARVRYAVQGQRAPEPPAGLEAYRFLGDGPLGWWTLDAAL